MFKLLIDGQEFGEFSDMGRVDDALNLIEVLKEVMPDSNFWIETPNGCYKY